MTTHGDTEPSRQSQPIWWPPVQAFEICLGPTSRHHATLSQRLDRENGPCIAPEWGRGTCPNQCRVHGPLQVAHLDPRALKQRERGKGIVPFFLDILVFFLLSAYCFQNILSKFFSVLFLVLWMEPSTSGMLSKYSTLGCRVSYTLGPTFRITFVALFNKFP